MSERYIYVVFGGAGEYSDHREWPVSAYFSEELAQELVVLASARARELKEQYEYYWDIPEGANEYDPEMKTDYTGTNYFVFKVNIVDAQ